MRGPLTVTASLVAEHRLQTRRLSNCGSRAQLLRGMWDLPRPGLEPVSAALAGRFSTTAPPGKPLRCPFKCRLDLVTHFQRTEYGRGEGEKPGSYCLNQVITSNITSGKVTLVLCIHSLRLWALPKNPWSQSDHEERADIPSSGTFYTIPRHCFSELSGWRKLRKVWEIGKVRETKEAWQLIRCYLDPGTGKRY